MVALKGPVVAELTTIIYANPYRASLRRNNDYGTVKGALKLNKLFEVRP